jgi:exoribonuclease II
LFENKNIRFAKIKFSGVAQLYYESVKDYMEKMGEPLVTN